MSRPMTDRERIRQAVLAHTFAEIDDHVECMCGRVTDDPAGHVADAIIKALT